MDRNLFTSIPCSENTNFLSLQVKEIICNKLISIIKQISDQLSLQTSMEIEKIENRGEGLINPILFHYYFKLKEASFVGDLNAILDVISLLSYHPILIKKEEQKYPNISSIIDTEWERDFFDNNVRKEIVSEFGMKNKFEILKPIFHSELMLHKNDIKKAIDILRDSDLMHFDASVNQLVSIKIFDGTVRGFSYQEVYGNIYIRASQEGTNHVAYYLEHIIHECAHQHLFALQLLDPIVVNDKSELFDAPIRVEKRPMNGIFHACFVLARMLRGFKKSKIFLEKSSYDEFLSRIDAWFLKSYSTVKEYAKMTENGRQVFNSLKECAYG